jgi:hypothetical protein
MLSNLQFVILLVAIFLFSGGPWHVQRYYLWFQKLLFNYRVKKIRKDLGRFGTILRGHQVGKTVVICSEADFQEELALRRNDKNIVEVWDHSCIFSDTYEDTVIVGKLSEISTTLAEIMYNLLDRKYNRSIFSPEMVEELRRTITRYDKRLQVPFGTEKKETWWNVYHRFHSDLLIDRVIVQARKKLIKL